MPLRHSSDYNSSTILIINSCFWEILIYARKKICFTKRKRVLLERHSAFDRVTLYIKGSVLVSTRHPYIVICSVPNMVL